MSHEQVIDAPESPIGELELVGPLAGRSTATYEAYLAHQRRQPPGSCPFCAYTCVPHEDRIGEVGTMCIIGNRFPYAVWDSQIVEDHLMVVPSRHLLSFGEFTEQEGTDHFHAIREYETRGYSVYTRSQGNTGRSVGHLHTHLILTGRWVG